MNSRNTRRPSDQKRSTPRGRKALRAIRSGRARPVLPRAVEAEARTVMMVDDDEDILLTARLLLERRGFHVVTRTSIPEWEELQRVRPCVVFMDINLGQESGLMACEAIKRNRSFSGLPVILVSGMDHERLANAASDRFADGFLSKPYTGDLLAALAEHYAAAPGSSPG